MHARDKDFHVLPSARGCGGKRPVVTDRPQSLGRDRKFSVATGVVQPCVAIDILCRDRAWGWCYDSVSYRDSPAGLAYATGARTTSAPRATECARAGATEEFRRNREFSLMTDFVVFSVTTRKSLSRQGLGVGTVEARETEPATAHTACSTALTTRTMCAELCTGQSYNSVLRCALFGVTVHRHCSRTLFIDTVHEHCSWALLKKKKDP